MAKPRIFVSSTYYDLKHLRASLEVFIESFGYDPILSEFGAVTYDPNQALDESCYREAQSADIFVLIIGGRYGSAASGASEKRTAEQQYESITRKEFSKAHDADVPVYVLIETGVHSEYQTYLRNKDNNSIAYAHVDSSKVFEFIEFIYSKQRNNPIQSFEKGGDVETWLRDQWAGMFQEMLRSRKDNSRFSDLAAQIRQLEAVNGTLKSYLESVLQSVSPEKSTELIDRENKTLSLAQLRQKLERNLWYKHVEEETLLGFYEIVEMSESIKSVSDIIGRYNQHIASVELTRKVLSALDDYDDARQDFNSMRETLGLRKVKFTKKFLAELSGFLGRADAADVADEADEIEDD